MKSYPITACLSLCWMLIASNFCGATPPDSTFKDWYFTPTGVYGRTPVTDTRYRTYIKILRHDPDVITVQKFNPADRLVDVYEVRFADGMISLITETNEWGEAIDSMWFKPEDKDNFVVTDRRNGQNPYLPCQAERYTYKNGLLSEILCLADSTKPGTNQEGVAHYVFDRYDDLERFGLLKSETFYNEIDMPVYSRNAGCHQLTFEYDKKANLVSRSAYNEKNKPMTDRSGAFRTTYKYDGDDNETEIDYLNETGSPVITNLGYARLGFDYKKGFLVTETCYDFNYNKVVSNGLADSVAMTLYRYDKAGHVTEKAFFFPDGSRMADKNGINRITSEYSSSGMLTATTEYGLFGKSPEQEQEVASHYYRRDEKGHMTSLFSTNTLHRGAAIIGDGTLLTKFSYDNWGRVSSTSYWLEDSIKTHCLQGYHERKVLYNKDGQVSEYDYYDEAGRPATNLGYSRELVAYNQQGLISDKRYFDGDMPVSVTTLVSFAAYYHEIKYGYDLFNRLRTIEYFDVSDKPVNAIIRNAIGNSFQDQRIDINYAGERITGQELHDSGDIAKPVFLNCASKECIPMPGYVLPTGIVLTLSREHAYHGRIKPDSLYGDQLDFISRDSVLLFLNAAGTSLSPIACADRYRIVRINKYYQQDGLAIDRFLENDSIAARLSYSEGTLNGLCVYYYPNGTIKEKGEYTKNTRTGFWDYYFDNGQLAKTIDFTGKTPLLVRCYSLDGKPLVQQGNGHFVGSIMAGTLRTRQLYTMSGLIRNGLPDGEWKLYGPFISGPSNIEYFSAGVFQKGISIAYMGKSEYRQNPLSRFESIHPEESLDYYGENNTCFVKGLRREHQTDVNDWFTELNTGFGEIMRTNQFKDYSGWVLLDLKFDEDGSITNQSVRLYQPNDGFKTAILNIMDRLEHHAEVDVNNKKTSYEKFFIVLVDGGEVVIPEQLLNRQRAMQR